MTIKKGFRKMRKPFRIATEFYGIIIPRKNLKYNEVNHIFMYFSGKTTLFIASA